MFSTEKEKESLRSKILNQNACKCEYCNNQATKIYTSTDKSKTIKASDMKKLEFKCLCDSDSKTYKLWAKLSSVGRKESIKVLELTEQGELIEV